MRWFDWLVSVSVLAILGLLAVIGFIGGDNFNGMGSIAFAVIFAVLLAANNIGWRFKIIDVEEKSRNAGPVM
jgi:hypothetical protein